MGKSIIQSIKETLGQEADRKGPISPELAQRIEDVSSVFPDILSIVPAENIDPEWCFRVEIKGGDRFLVWTNKSELTGLTEDDGTSLFTDFEIAKQINHQNTLTPLHITRVGVHAIVVTEDFAGQALHRIIRKQTYTLDTVREIYREITDAFEINHQNGVMHRALCPANVLIDDDMHIRVFGFGLANIFFERWDKTLSKKRRRLTDYLAPELENTGLRAAVPHCDIFSIGRITYELLLGQLPKNFIAVLPSKACEVPPYLDDALLNAMHGDPKMRPQTIRDFREMFYGIRFREPILRQLGDRGKTGGAAGFFDSCLPWLAKYIFHVGITAFVLTALAIVLILMDSDPSDPIHVSLVPEVKIESFHKDWEKIPTEDLKVEYKRNKQQYETTIESTYHSMVDNDQFEEADLFLDKMIGTGSAEFSGRLKTYDRDVEEFQEMIDIAKANRLRGDSIAEEAALARATELYPKSKYAATLRHNNPRRIATNLATALKKLKATNPSQSDWHYHLMVKNDRVILDLSGHENLTNLSALNGQVINELDLSHTAVDSLIDLIGLPLDELRLDHTNIANLSSIAGLPLEVLTFTSTSVTDLSPLRNIPGLRCVLGQNEDGPYQKISPPEVGQKTWIDERGLKFRELSGMGVMMAETEYPKSDGESAQTSISFRDAQNICSHMTMRQRKSKTIDSNHRYRLPTDGEWSFAAQLPESQFLSPTGRQLQRIEEADFLERRKALTVLEISSNSEEHKHAHNGFKGMKNKIGEWVDQNQKQWDNAYIVRGICDGSDMEKLRLRATKASDTAVDIIGFRPVLEIDSKMQDWVTIDTSSPQNLTSIALGSWETPHLAAAASSTLLLKQLLRNQAYLSSYIASPFNEVDPFANRRYIRVDLPLPWNDAKVLAQQLGGRLATAENEGHLSWIYDRFVDNNNLGTPLWLGASALAESSKWTWITQKAVPESITPDRVDADKRRGALLVPDINSEPSMTATPLIERHSFLIEWETTEEGEQLSLGGYGFDNR